MRGRLRTLIRANGPTNAAFAHRCGFEPARVSEWLGGDQLPSIANLRQICTSIGVSADWLLLGDGGAEPIARQQSRSMVALEEDLAAAVRAFVHRREADGAFDTDPGSGVRMSLHGWIVDGAGLLQDAFRNEELKVRAWIEWEERTQPLRAISEEVMRALRVLVPLLPPDDTTAGRAVYELGAAAVEARAFAENVERPEEPNSFRRLTRARLSVYSVDKPADALRHREERLREFPAAEDHPLRSRIAENKARLAPNR